MEFKAKCSECKALVDCKTAFGRYWGEKSNGGMGCKHPFEGWGKKPPAELPKMPRRPRRMVQQELI